MSNCHFFFLFFFLFGRQTFSAPRKGCLGELTASWGGRRRSDHPLSQPQTHLVLLCRGRAECCIFLPWGSCCQPFSSPMLCSGQPPCLGSPRVAGGRGYGTAALPFLGYTWLSHGWHWVALLRETQPSWPTWGWSVLWSTAWGWVSGGWHMMQSEASLMSH